MKATKYILQIFILISFFGCQKEEISSTQDTNNIQNLVPNSVLAGLVLRVTQNPTSKDNIVDGSSCYSVQLPVTINVNNQQIILSTEADYQTVLTAMNASSNDDDLVSFIYPIVVKFKNFTTRIVSNSTQLDGILTNCEQDNDLNEMDCVSIKYPAIINIYNVNNQIASTVTIQNNKELFDFVKNLSSNIISAINYPISFVNFSGQTISINNNVELENIIKLSENDCGTNSIGMNGNPSLISFLTSGSWKISYFLKNNNDQTLNYTGYNFVFNTNKSCVAVKNTVTTNGKWSNSISGGKSKFKLKFDGSILDELGEKWKVIQFSNTLIKLKNDDKKEDKFLNFTKN